MSAAPEAKRYETLVDAEWIAAHYPISKRLVYSLARGELSHAVVRAGGRVLYHRGAVEAYFDPTRECATVTVGSLSLHQEKRNEEDND